MSDGNGFNRTAESARFSLNGALDPIAVNMLNMFSANLSTMSRQWMQQLLDPRRDIEQECGFPSINDTISVDVFRQLYERDAIAARCVQVLPKESWQVQPLVYEDEDAETETEFEKAWDELGQSLQPSKSWHREEHGSVIWEHLLRADILSGIGQFGVILLGIDDGRNLQDPVEGVIQVPEGHPALGTVKQHSDGSLKPGGSPEENPNKQSGLRQADSSLTSDSVTGSNKQQSAFPQRGESDNVMEADQPVPKGGNRAPPDSPSIRTGRQRKQTRNASGLDFKDEVRRLGRWFAKCGRAMPGYGQIWWNSREGKLWYVGRDGDERGFDVYVRAKLGMLVGGKEDVTYEAETSPKQVGWEQLYPKQGVKVLNYRPDSYMTKEEEAALLDPPLREVWNGKFTKEGKPETVSVKPPPPNEEEMRAIANWRREREETITWNAQPRFAGGPAGTNRIGSPIGGIDAQYSYDGGTIPGAFGGYAESKPGMALPPGSTLSGTDQQYFGVQFGPSEQLDVGTRKPHRLLFLRCFDESLVQIVRYEWNVNNPRFGMPVMYRITLNDPRQTVSGVGLPLATVYVHWSRVVHLADNRGSSEVFGYPRMRQVLNNLLSLRKLYGASPEGYWKSNFMKLSFETHPQLGGDVIVDQAKMQQLFDRIQNTLQEAWVAEGMSVKSIAPSVVDPSPHIDKQIEAICILIACPKRVFVGSERGELASAQDDSKWNDVLRHRQMFHLTPNLIVPFIDRLISLGVLSEPDEKNGYKVEWPDLDSTSKKDKGAIALSFAQAITAFVSGGCETLMTPHDFFVRIIGMDEEVAKEIIEAAVAHHEDQETMSIPPQIQGHDAEAPEGTAAAQQRDDSKEQAKQQAQQQAEALKAKFGEGGKPGGPGQNPNAKNQVTQQALSKDATQNVDAGGIECFIVDNQSPAVKVITDCAGNPVKDQ